VRWCSEVAAERRVAINEDAVAWSTRFDRALWESVESYDQSDVHRCPDDFRRPR
jgi:hypothetical protein